MALLASALATPAPAQLASVEVSNLSDEPRRGVVTAVVPFAPGAYHGGPLAVDGARIEARPFGMAWPDGSLRHARVHVPAVLGGQQRRTLHIVAGGDATVRPFAWNGAVVAALPRLALALTVDGHRAAFTDPEVVEDGHLVRAFRYRARVPSTTFWAELVLEFASRSPVVRYWLHYGDSDPRDPAIVHGVEEGIGFEVFGAEPVVHHAGAKLLGQRRDGELRVLRLGDARKWADGQSQAVAGALLFDDGNDPQTLAAAREVPLLAVAGNWPSSGAFGPWGHVPAPPEALDPVRVRRLVAADHARHRDGDPWAAPVHGCMPQPGSTGDQSDFSAIVCSLEANGWPERLHSIARSVRQEACRPTHLREADGSPVRFSERPEVLLWDCRPDHRITRDRLGKERALADWDVTPNEAGQRWWGHDRQHYSIHYLCAHALLTGDRWSVAECHHHVELWLGMMRVDSGSPVLDGMGAPRAVGRTLDAAAWLLLVTGRQDLAERVRARVARTAEQWRGGQVDGPVRTFDVIRDARKLDGRVPVWMPWQDAIAVRGLDAADRVLDLPQAKQIVWLAGRSLVELGLWRENGAWTCGDAVRWLDGGAPLDAAAWPQDRAGYRPFLTWAGPAVVIVRREAAARGETALAERCDAILTQLRADRSWRQLEWLGLR